MNHVKPISIIVAITENNGIGKNNQLLVHLPQDLKWFKRITQGHKVIMGKNTFFSLPKRPLQGRINVVLSDIPGEQIDGCLVAYSIEGVIEQCDENQENFIIGGASVYRQFLPCAQKLYITKIHTSLEADTYFPEIDPLLWEIIESEKHFADEKHPYDYTFTIYRRIQK
jgi:dihydrofolate reductase